MLQITTNEESPSIKIVIDGKISNLFPKNSLVITGTEEGLEFRSAYDIKNVWFKGEWDRGIKLNDTDITIENYETELSSLFFLSKVDLSNLVTDSELDTAIEDTKQEIDQKKENRVIKVTVETASDTAAKIGTTVGGNYVPQEEDVIEVLCVNGWNANSPTLSIDGGPGIPVKISSVNVTETTSNYPIHSGSGGVLRFFFSNNVWMAYGITYNDYRTTIQELEINELSDVTARYISGQRLGYFKQLYIDTLEARIAALEAQLNP